MQLTVKKIALFLRSPLSQLLQSWLQISYPVYSETYYVVSKNKLYRSPQFCNCPTGKKSGGYKLLPQAKKVIMRKAVRAASF